MLKRIVQACFLITGGTLGILLIPLLLELIKIDDIPIISNSYATAILGAIIFYLITFWAVDYVLEFIKWAEDSLVKIPVTDVIFGSLGLIFGLLVAFLIGFALKCNSRTYTKCGRSSFTDIIIWLLRLSGRI